MFVCVLGWRGGLEFNNSLMEKERKLLVLPLFWVVHVISPYLVV